MAARWIAEVFKVDLKVDVSFTPPLCPLRGQQRNAATSWGVSCVRATRSPMKNCRRCMRSLASRCFLCRKWATPWPPASPPPPLCLTWWGLTGSTPGSTPTLRYRQNENNGATHLEIFSNLQSFTVFRICDYLFPNPLPQRQVYVILHKSTKGSFFFSPPVIPVGDLHLVSISVLFSASCLSEDPHSCVV